ncbi:MAG: glycosyltransferase family 39 protein, partial [Phycisphaerales bacterium]
MVPGAHTSSQRIGQPTDATSNRTMPPKWLIIVLCALGIGMRVHHFDSPPIGHHQWRQSDTASVSRNMMQGDGSLWRPTMDWRGDGDGAVEMEFPLYQAAVATLYSILDVHHWIPRLCSVAANLLSVWIVFLLVRRISDDATAAWTACTLIVLPLYAFFGRAIQPEAWMVCAFVCSVYCFLRWSQTQRMAWFTCAAGATALAILLKLPSVVVGLPLLGIAMHRFGWRFLTRPMLWVFAIISLGLPVVWYTHAHQIGIASGNSFGIARSDKWLAFSTLARPGFYANVFVGKIAEDHLAIVGVPLALLGMVVCKRKGQEWILALWMVAMLVHIAFIAVGHSVHDYYQLPMTIPLAFYIGRFLARSRWTVQSPKLGHVLVIVLACTSMYTIAKLYRKERPQRASSVTLAEAIARATTADDLVVIVDGYPSGDPAVLYLADRKGWILPFDAIAPEAVRTFADRGAVIIASDLSMLRSAEAVER